MIENRDFCRQQIARMAQMERFPGTEKIEALSELINAAQNAPSEQYLKDAIDGFIEDAGRETRCPMPADIKHAIKLLQKEREGEYEPDPDCVECLGGGFLARGRCNCWARRHPQRNSKLESSRFNISSTRQMIERG